MLQYYDEYVDYVGLLQYKVLVSDFLLNMFCRAHEEKHPQEELIYQYWKKSRANG